MKVVFAGGGTGGHFFPLIAVAESLQRIANEQSLSQLQMYFFSKDPLDPASLARYDIKFEAVPSGKINSIAGLVRLGVGVLVAIWKLFWIYPDVVFSKGAYVSIPTCVAARILGIPLVIHESDVVAGRANLWVGRFADRIAVSYPQAAAQFDSARVAYTGQPIRSGLIRSNADAGYALFRLDRDIPVVLILGGSQGAVRINEVILQTLDGLLYEYQVIHQVGKNNIDTVIAESRTLLRDHPYANRYHSVSFLDTEHMIAAAGAAKVVITRAGSALFEIANWGIPAIVIPITDSLGDHQRKDAYAYAQTGSAVVVEEENLSPEILVSEINRIIQNQSVYDQMVQSTKNFARLDAAETIARELLAIADTHETRHQMPLTTTPVLEEIDKQEGTDSQYTVNDR